MEVLHLENIAESLRSIAHSLKVVEFTTIWFGPFLFIAIMKYLWTWK